MLVDHLFQYRISQWPKTIEKRGFCTCVTDIRTDGPTDRPSYRDAFLTDASKNEIKSGGSKVGRADTKIGYQNTKTKTKHFNRFRVRPNFRVPGPRDTALKELLSQRVKSGIKRYVMD